MTVTCFGWKFSHISLNIQQKWHRMILLHFKHAYQMVLGYFNVKKGNGAYFLLQNMQRNFFPCQSMHCLYKIFLYVFFLFLTCFSITFRSITNKYFKFSWNNWMQIFWIHFFGIIDLNRVFYRQNPNAICFEIVEYLLINAVFKSKQIQRWIHRALSICDILIMPIKMLSNYYHIHIHTYELYSSKRHIHAST